MYMYIKNPDFRRWVDLYDKNNVLIFQELGNVDTEKPLYYMRFDDETWGFFACWKFMIYGLAFAEYYNLTPVVNWTKNNPYYEKTRCLPNNAFEYYFEPVSNVPFSDAEKGRKVVLCRDYVDRIAEFSNITYENADEKIITYAKYNKKYVFIRDEIKAQINKEINALLQGKKTIAVHIRGVEWGNIAGHPDSPELTKYFLQIDAAITEKNFEQIFLATDSEDTLAQCKKRYGDRIVTYDDVLRARSGSKTLMIFDQSVHRKDHHFLLGYEVLRDMITMVHCDGLIAGYSNVSLAARTFKFNMNKSYEYLYINEPIIVTTGISSHQAVKMMKNDKF